MASRVKDYKDIVDIAGLDEAISIKFTDKSSIKVYISEGNVHKVLRIIKKKREEQNVENFVI